MSFEFWFFGSFGSIAFIIALFVYYSSGDFKSIYTRNNNKFSNYTVANILLSMAFLPVELFSIIASGNWLTKRPFRSQRFKVGDKINDNGTIREVLSVRLNEQFEEVVELSGYTDYQLGKYQLSEYLKDKKISPLQELL